VRRPRGPAALEDATGFDGGATPVDDGVHRVLLLVDAACSASDVQRLVSGGPTEVFVVAPAVSSRLDRWTGDEHAYASADDHLEQTLGALRGVGVEARGHVGAHDPLQAADDGLREFPADELVFALAGEGGSAWLENGVVETARDRYTVPVRSLALGRAGATSTEA
jgi:GABA permease